VGVRLAVIAVTVIASVAKQSRAATSAWLIEIASLRFRAPRNDTQKKRRAQGPASVLPAEPTTPYREEQLWQSIAAWEDAATNHHSSN
jgi:hypothetical protein